MLTKINVDLGERSYPIYLTTDYSHLTNILEQAGICGKVLIVTDTNVQKYHADNILETLSRVYPETYLHVIPAGEKSKSNDVLLSIYDSLSQNKFDRYSTIIALGGGVVGDIAGYAAATYFRGINFVQVPTSLLAQVDSSVGGKVGIDYKEYKNVIGSFYQPKFVYINVNSLKTLPEREIRAGLGEVLKHCIIRSLDLFEYVEFNAKNVFCFEEEVLLYIIKENCKIKASVVGSDEREETGARAILNFGHTIGHAIESSAGFTLLHGECVAIGITGAFKLAYKLKMVDEKICDRITAVFKKLGLMTTISGLNAEDIFNRIFHDKKIRNGKLFFVLPREIGNVEYLPVNDMEAIKETIEELLEQKVAQ